MIRHSKPYISDFKCIKNIIRNQNFSRGGYVLEFEKKLSDYMGLKYSLTTNSGTNALFLAIKSLDLKPTSRILIPSLTCSAVLNAVVMAGHVPVICDVDVSDFNYNMDLLGKIIKKQNISCIVVVYPFGIISDKIKLIKRLNIPVIEDIAQAFGAELNGRKLGSYSDISVVSFYATKMITSFGEGGAVFTNNPVIYRKLINFIEYDNKPRYSEGYSMKMTEIQACYGINQLEKLESFIRRRKKIAALYDRILSRKKNVVLYPQKRSQSIYYRYVFGINGISKNNLVKKFMKKNIEVKDIISVPLDKYYYGKYKCIESQNIYQNSISIPLYPSLTEKEIKHISKSLDEIFENV